MTGLEVGLFGCETCKRPVAQSEPSEMFARSCPFLPSTIRPIQVLFSLIANVQYNVCSLSRDLSWVQVFHRSFPDTSASRIQSYWRFSGIFCSSSCEGGALLFYTIQDSDHYFPHLPLVQQAMENLSLFRLSTFVYFFEKISKAEGTTDETRKRIRDTLEGKPGTQRVVERIAAMATIERLTALSQFINILKTYAAGTRNITNQGWLTRIDRCFSDNDDDDGPAISNKDPTNSTYEVLAVKRPGGSEFDFLGTVIVGCNLVSLDGFCLLAQMPKVSADKVKRQVLDDGNYWRVKCPFRGVELFIECHEAVDYCNEHCHSLKGQQIIQWLKRQPANPPNDPTYRRRFRMLEAVDSSRYVITFLGEVPGAGHLVLIRASDGLVHTASFLKACVGLPVTQLDVWDDHCARLSNLMSGPVKFRLDPAQIDLLTIPVPPTPVIVVDCRGVE